MTTRPNAKRPAPPRIEYLKVQNFRALREELDDAKTQDNLDQISLQANKILRMQLLKVEHLIDSAKDYTEAAQAVRALMFVERFSQDIEVRYDMLAL